MCICVTGCAVSGQTMTCNATSPINVGGSVRYSIEVQAVQPGTFNTSATVTANGDINPANNGPAINSIVVVSAG